MSRNKYILLLLLMGLFLVRSGAQTVTCPPNADFEFGSFLNWKLYTGSCCPINTPTSSAPLANRHVITSGFNLDQYGGFPTVAPQGGGQFSLKLGNNSTGAQAERARYYVRVPNDVNNYSLFLRYAVVFQNPNHTPAEQPRFEVKAFDSATNVAIPCVQFSFVASSVLPGFVLSGVSSQVWYKPWSSVSLNLSGYAGKTIAIDFASGDCGPGAHFGYGYVDLNCGLFKVTSVICKSSVSSGLTAPPGFQQYKWYDSTFHTLIGTTQSISVPSSATYNKYYVVLVPYPGYGCPDTLSTDLYQSDMNIKLQRDTNFCNQPHLQLVNTATASQSFLPITYSWNPSASLSCATCLNPVASPTATTKYILTSTDAMGCVQKDTFTISIKFAIKVQPANLNLCPGKNAVFTVAVDGSGVFTYTWKKDGVPIPGSDNDTLVLSNIGYNDAGTYTVNISGDCGQLNSVPAKLLVYTPPVLASKLKPVFQCANTKASFIAGASSNGPMTYVWKKNGITIPSATKDTFTINSINPADTGSYYVVVRGACDTTYSDTVKLSIKPATVVSLQPANLVGCDSSRLVFRINSSGYDSLSYMWKKDGVVFGKSTNTDSLVFDPVSVLDSGTYSVVVFGGCNLTTSNQAKLIVTPRTKITRQPANIIMCYDSLSKAVFATKATGTGTLHYQWKKNGVDIAGATRDSLLLSPLLPSDTASYTVEVIGDCGTVLSNPATLYFYTKPVITRQPLPQRLCPGTRATIAVDAKSNGPFTCVWRKNGITIPGVSKDSLVINPLAYGDSGLYSVLIKGVCDTVPSNVVKLGVKQRVSITREPQNIVRCESSAAEFSVDATGSDTLIYQWWKNGNLLAAVPDNDTLGFKKLVYADSGSYNVFVTGACNTAISSTAKLTINALAKITQQPKSVMLCLGTRAAFTVKGIGIKSWQWRKNGVPISGAITDSLIIDPVTKTDAANYSVVVKGLCDSIISVNATLFTHPVPKSDLKDPIALCKNVGSVEISGFEEYLWSTGSTAASTPVTQDGTYWVRYKDANTCVNTDTTHITMLYLPEVEAGPDTTICNELSLKLQGTASNYLSVKWAESPYGHFLWPDSLSTVFVPQKGLKGEKLLSFTATNVCGTVGDDMAADFRPKTRPDFYPKDTLACEGGLPIELIPQNTGGIFSGENVNSNYFSPVKTGLYRIGYFIEQYSCSDSAQHDIRVIHTPIANFTWSDKTLSVDQPTVFTARSVYAQRYAWYFDNVFVTTTDSPSFHYTHEGTYRITLFAFNSICVDSESKFIYIKGTDHIFVPNVFTPDLDGINDRFKVVHANTGAAELSVYDRWGKLVYISTDLNEGWDGTMKGEPCQTDVYFYLVNYTRNDGSRKMLKGTVTLLR